MIVEKLHTVQSLLEAREQQRGEKKQLDSLAAYRDDLANLKTHWDQVVATVPFLDADRALVRGIAEQLTFVTGRFSSYASRDDLAPLRRMIDELERDALARWSIRKIQWTDSALLNRARVLVVIGTPEVRSSIAQLVRSLHFALQQDGLPSPQLLNTLEQMQDQLRDKVAAALPPMAPEVEQFLSQLADGTADLEMVTTEILAWCRRQGLTNRIALSITGG